MASLDPWISINRLQGYDRMPAWFKWLLPPVCFQIQMHLINESVSRSYVLTTQSQWNTVNINPTPKVSKSEKPANLWLILVVLILSRIVERIMFTHIYILPSAYHQLKINWKTSLLSGQWDPQLLQSEVSYKKISTTLLTIL